MKWKDKDPLISVCILNHNWEKRLPKSIPSILSQEYNNLEILFLDNWSTDKSLEYIEQFKEIKIIKNNTNLWTSGWRNKLASQCIWKYILFLDNDIELTGKDFLNKILDDYKELKEQNIWVIFPISQMEWSTKISSTWLYFNKLQKNINFHDIYKTWFHPRPWFSWQSFFMEKETFTKTWGFDEKYLFNMDDYDLSARLYNMGYTIYLDSNLYIIHHWIDTRSSGKSQWWKNQSYFCGFCRMIAKNYLTKNILKWGFISVWWIFIKTVKQTIKYKSLLPLKWFLISVKNFFRDLPDTLRQRKYWQKRRKTNDDIFLKIK